MPEMSECNFGAVSSDGAEGQDRCGAVTGQPGGAALAGNLLVLDAVAAKIASIRSRKGSALSETICLKYFSANGFRVC